MNVRERFKEVMSFNTSIAPPKWEFGYWGANYENNIPVFQGKRTPMWIFTLPAGSRSKRNGCRRESR
jgi:hypothetical protein